MTQRTKVLEALETIAAPATSKQISEMLGIRIETVASNLTELWRSKAVKRRSASPNGKRGGRHFVYVPAASDAQGFEPAVSAKKSVKKRAPEKPLPVLERPMTFRTSQPIPTIVATLTIPINGRLITLELNEARQMYEQLLAWFDVARPAA